MTREEIMDMAHEAGIRIAWQSDTIDPRNVYAHELLSFAALVAAAEREACAKVCEETTAAWTQYLYNSGCVDCAEAIRARGGE
jgi:hypothetical protein